MARQSDADLIRAITGGISEIGSLFKPTNAELQSQRITSQETQAALSREYETARIDSQREYEENQFAHKLVLKEIDETLNIYKQRTEAQELKGIALENAGPSNKYTKGYIELLNQGFKNDDASKLELVNFLDDISQANDALYANEANIAALDRAGKAMFIKADTDKDFNMSEDEFKVFAEASDMDERELQYVKDNFTKNAPTYAEEAAEKIKSDAIIKYGDLSAGLEVKKAKADIAKTLEETKGQELENSKTRLEINAIIDTATDSNNGIMPIDMRGQFGFTNREGYRLPKTGDKDTDELTAEWNSIASATLETGTAKGTGKYYSQNAINFVHGVMTNKKLGGKSDFTKADAKSFLEDSVNPVQWLTSSDLTDRQKAQLISLSKNYYQPMQGISQAERDRLAKVLNGNGDKDTSDNNTNEATGDGRVSSLDGDIRFNDTLLGKGMKGIDEFYRTILPGFYEKNVPKAVKDNLTDDYDKNAEYLLDYVKRVTPEKLGEVKENLERGSANRAYNKSLNTIEARPANADEPSKFLTPDRVVNSVVKTVGDFKNATDKAIAEVLIANYKMSGIGMLAEHLESKQRKTKEEKAILKAINNSKEIKNLSWKDIGRRKASSMNTAPANSTATR